MIREMCRGKKSRTKIKADKQLYIYTYYYFYRYIYKHIYNIYRHLLDNGKNEQQWFVVRCERTSDKCIYCTNSTN